MSVQRSFEALAKLPSRVVAPRYKSSDLRAGIVHIGVGNFHRAHQAVYLDDLFNAGVDRDWAIIGAGVREADVDMRAKLAVQDWLTTVVEQETSVSTARVTGAMIDFVKPFDVEAMLDMLARPQYPHRVADGHRGRLLHLAGDAVVRSGASRYRPRRAQPGRAEDGVRADRRGPQAQAHGGRRALHRDVVRQHPRQLAM